MVERGILWTRAATEDPTTNDEDKAIKILSDTSLKTDDG